MSSYRHRGNQPPPIDPLVLLRTLWETKRQLVLGLGAAAVALIGMSSSYYQVEPDEVGMLLRFGRYSGKSEPGPHFKLPFGIDEVVKVPVQRQLKMEFGFRTSRADVESEFVRPEHAVAEATMLTGDLNVALVEWIVQYRITDPEAFLFHFRDVNMTLHLMTEATMRYVVGDHSIDEVLTDGRVAIEDQAKIQLQALAERYGVGVTIQQLKLQDVNAPEGVRPALREVEEAKQERERVINDAWADYNKLIPQARGQAQQAMLAAEGYSVERVNRARGDADRFKQLAAEYRKAPSVTRTRIYLEAMEQVLPQARQKIIVDPAAKNLLPLLNLGGRGGAQ